MISSAYRTAKWCVQRLPSGVLRFRPFGVYEIPLVARRKSGSRAKTCDVFDVSVQWITSRDELAELTELADRENLDAWDGETRRVAVARVDGLPVAAAWIATESFAEPELGLSYRLQSDDAWLFAAVVQEQHRRRGIYSAMLRFLIDELSREGTRRILLGVAAGNEASLAAHRKFDAEPIGSILAVRSLGFGLCRTSGQVSRATRSVVVWRKALEVCIST